MITVFPCISPSAESAQYAKNLWYLGIWQSTIFCREPEAEKTIMPT